MAKNGTVFNKSGGIYHPLTNSDQVIVPGGDRLTGYLFDTINAIKGKGAKSAANTWPMLHLGDYSSMSALNVDLNGVYQTTNPKYQGHLRMNVNSQTLFVEQIAIDYENGFWAQMAIGLVAPSSDGSQLIKSNKPGIYFRSRRPDGQDNIINEPWQSLGDISLKTINGQEITGTGNITIGGDGSSLSIDSSLDPTSNNAISNKAVALAIMALNHPTNETSDGGGVVILKGWTYNSEFNITPQEGDYGYIEIEKRIVRYVSGNWENYGTPQSNIIYINVPGQVACYWNGTNMMSLYGDTPLSIVNIHSSKPVNSLAVSKFIEGIIDNVFNEMEDMQNNLLSKMVFDTNVTSEGDDSHAPSTKAVYDFVNEQKDTFIPDTNPSSTKTPTTKAVKDYIDDIAQNLSGNTTPVNAINQNTQPGELPTVGAVVGFIERSLADALEAVDITIDGKNGWGTNNFGNPMFPEYYLEVEYDGQTRLLGELVNSNDEDENNAAEEFKSTIKWGVDYYNWPLRCFNGTVSGVTALASGASDVEVLFPSERIWMRDNMMEENDHTTNDVYFHTDLNCFVLLHNGKYYKSWGNSAEWNYKPNDDILGRVDCVFSDIHLEDDINLAGTDNGNNDWSPSMTGQSRRVSYIRMQPSPSAALILVDITTLMTDFTKAVHDCLASTTGKRKGDMRLSDRIYYVGNVGKPTQSAMTTNSSTYRVAAYSKKNTATVYDVVTHKQLTGNRDTNYLMNVGEASNYTIDGGKGTLFYRTYSMFIPHQKAPDSLAAFTIKNSSNCTLKNLTMRTLRDRDNSIAAFPGTHTNPFSCSDSCIVAFELGDGSQNILLDNIDICGFSHDFACGGSTSDHITVKNFRSREMWMAIISGTNWVMENCDIVQRDCAGCNMHIFYPHTGESTVLDLTMKNSRLKQGKYSSVAVALHEIDNNSARSSKMVFEDCVFEGGYFFGGSGSQNIVCPVFNRCRFIQIYDKHISDNGYVNTTYFFGSRSLSWTLNECYAELLRNDLFGNYERSNSNSQSLIITNSEIYTHDTESSHIIWTDHKKPSKITFENIQTNIVNPPLNGTINKAPSGWASSADDYTLNQLTGKITTLSGTVSAVESSLNVVSNTVDTFESSIGTLNDILNGHEGTVSYTSISSASMLPKTAAVGDAYLSTDDNILHVCTEAGTYGTAYIKVSAVPPSKEDSQEVTENNTISFALSTNEVFNITIQGSSEDTRDTVKTKIRNIFTGLGYTEGNNWDAKTPGTFVFRDTSISAPSTSFRITAKDMGTGLSSTNSSGSLKDMTTSGTTSIRFLLGSTVSGNDVNKSWRGTDCKWSETEFTGQGGLVLAVSSLESTVANNRIAIEDKTQEIDGRLDNVEEIIPFVGMTKHRPDISAVVIGRCFFDVQAGRPMWATANGWVYADGTPVTDTPVTDEPVEHGL